MRRRRNDLYCLGETKRFSDPSIRSWYKQFVLEYYGLGIKNKLEIHNEEQSRDNSKRRSSIRRDALSRSSSEDPVPDLTSEKTPNVTVFKRFFHRRYDIMTIIDNKMNGKPLVDHNLGKPLTFVSRYNTVEDQIVEHLLSVGMKDIPFSSIAKFLIAKKGALNVCLCRDYEDDNTLPALEKYGVLYSEQKPRRYKSTNGWIFSKTQKTTYFGCKDVLRDILENGHLRENKKVSFYDSSEILIQDFFVPCENAEAFAKQGMSSLGCSSCTITDSHCLITRVNKNS